MDVRSRPSLGLVRTAAVCLGVVCWSGSPPADYTPIIALGMSGLPSVPVPANLPDAIVPDNAAGTVRVGRESRPARLVKGPQRIERTIEEPLGGARLELAIAAVRDTATFRVQANGVEVANVKAFPGVWTSVVLDIPASLRPMKTVHLVEELSTVPDGLTFWGDDRLVRKWPARTRPDVFVISLDTVRPDYLTPYNAAESTPALAAFAKEATRFDQAISVSSWTLPAHEAIFTGTYPDIDGGRIEEPEATLAETFAAAGYDTFGISGGPFTDAEFGFQRGFASYLDSLPGKRGAETTTIALERIRQASPATPIFAFLNYFDAHEANTGISAVEWRDMDSREFHWTPEAVSRIRDAYRHDVRSVDREVGRLLDGIRRTRDWRNTVVIVLGDHGQLLGERGMIGHALRLDEELIHVPLLVKAPHGVHLPTHYADQVQLTDVFPLVMELAGIAPERGSIVSRVAAGRPVRALTFAQVRHVADRDLLDSSQWLSSSLQLVRTDTLRAVRDAEARLTVTATGDCQHSLDPASVPSLFHELDTFGSQGQTDGPVRIRRDVLNRLKALGYLR